MDGSDYGRTRSSEGSQQVNQRDLVPNIKM